MHDRCVGESEAAVGRLRPLEETLSGNSRSARSSTLLMSTSRRPPIQYGKRSSQSSTTAKASRLNEISRPAPNPKRVGSEDEGYGDLALPRKKRRRTLDEHSNIALGPEDEQTNNLANSSLVAPQAEDRLDIDHRPEEESGTGNNVYDEEPVDDPFIINGRQPGPSSQRIYGSNRRSNSDSSPLRASPRDLSAIFDVNSTRSLPPSPSKRGTAKRMLARHRTEPTLSSELSGSPSQPKPLTKTYSLPATQVTTTSQSTPVPLDDTANKSHPKQSPHKRTYAKSRSFLVAIPASQIAVSRLPEDDDKHLLRGSQNDSTQHEDTDALEETYDDLRLRWGVDDSVSYWSVFSSARKSHGN